MKLKLSSLLLPAIVVIIAIVVYLQLGDGEPSTKRDKKTRAIPVEVGPIRQGPIALRRNFTGTLEASAEFTVSPKIDGRIDELMVDLGDLIRKDEVVAVLDSAEYQQSVAQADADLAVAVANLAEARSQLTISERELNRLESLSKKGVSSASQVDTARAQQLARAAHVQVSRAQVTRAESALETARIRLAYTQVRAAWHGGQDTRVVAERFLDEGETVTANEPLIRIVDLDPVIAVFFVTERDYAMLELQQQVELLTDVYPDEVFYGKVSRIAPVFDEGTRQARVEVSVDNHDSRLKAGMYVRARVVLKTVELTTVIPQQAVTTRDGIKGVFVLSGDNEQVTWKPVKTGIREGNLIQVTGEGLNGKVVTLGQQLLDDGSMVSVQSGQQSQ
jgi:RND family efflux transporter MFP subunit